MEKELARLATISGLTARAAGRSAAQTDDQTHPPGWRQNPAYRPTCVTVRGMLPRTGSLCKQRMSQRPESIARRPASAARSVRVGATWEKSRALGRNEGALWEFVGNCGKSVLDSVAAVGPVLQGLFCP